MPNNYRKVPVNVIAEEFTLSNWENVCNLLDIPYRGPIERSPSVIDGSIRMSVPTPKGTIEVKEGDYLVKEPDGTISVRKPESFKSNYEKA